RDRPSAGESSPASCSAGMSASRGQARAPRHRGAFVWPTPRNGREPRRSRASLALQAVLTDQVFDVLAADEAVEEGVHDHALEIGRLDDEDEHALAVTPP